MGLSYQP
jgi:hypothetical protein